jgi:two-component system cell cycle response regulator CpdR
MEVPSLWRSMKSLSVLVADDEEEIRGLLVHWLVAAGHRVMSVTSGNEARKIILQHRFDVVVTDVLMPEGDGIQLINDLKVAQPNTRILAISGGGRYVESDNCLKIALGLGAHAAVMKPFSREQLLAGVVEALGPPPTPDK